MAIIPPPTIDTQPGILLYYSYVEVPDPESLANWYRAMCERLDLKGRIRVAPDGINVTVGGTMSSLDQHMEEVNHHPLLSHGNGASNPIDFKLSANTGAKSPACTLESGFNTLKVTVCKALITLGRAHAVGNSGPHLKPQEFHAMLDEVATGEGGATPPLVLLDARNIYETRVGHFKVPGAPTLDPRTRQLSDLPGWLDQRLEELRGKRVLMYCTGGVRCESVSSYLRSKGQDFQEVYQLSGGIQRYLEAFPDGGYFQGENFVFDERVTVGPALGVKEIVGRCLVCEQPYGDYSARLRCHQCRLLLLVCDGCRARIEEGELCCELCKEKDGGGSRKKRRRRFRKKGDVDQSDGMKGSPQRRVRTAQPIEEEESIEGVLYNLLQLDDLI